MGLGVVRPVVTGSVCHCVRKCENYLVVFRVSFGLPVGLGWDGM